MDILLELFSKPTYVSFDLTGKNQKLPTAYPIKANSWERIQNVAAARTAFMGKRFCSRSRYRGR